ncbi:hypothetical protein K491DRAFT_703107 [Lophiostoma macrostomum CBS 122681]|uniref:Stress response protein NST1 n=1 Tax=Lophiostoma macrostomum CBS 122681 TaxID=1314788 RepID=A0A6A6TDC1_9PLEO|nr:hypothetical protein K491DRAFT_703107 [Lophiostoma macrostomum CBS 122681]
MAQGTKAPAAPPAPLNGTSHPPVPGGVNRKKQKRREKLAAKQAAEAQRLGAPPAKNGHSQGPSSQQAPQYSDPALGDPAQYDDEGEYYSDEDGEPYEQAYAPNGHGPSAYTDALGGGAAGKKPKKKKRAASSAQQPVYNPPGALHHVPMHPANQSHSASKGNMSKDRIWNTSTSEERERIREFWLSLGEDDRKSLVKIEKEAVLKKMKEQQKHSCSCSVCGRKRTAIEEELEVLYDAYYEELEQYANHQQDGGPILPPVSYAHPTHRHGIIRHPPAAHYDDTDDLSQGEDDEGDPDYSNSEISSDEGDYSSEEPISLPPPESDFLQFGSSLQVKGGILTVADDLLKNDGKKFIEMMEQLAERRMQREEEAQYQSHGPGMYGRSHSGHQHGPPPEEDDYDEEDDDEEGYDDGYDEEEEEEEDDAMTEEQRMEEGRRMFQIFAARMFEQRVLQAYREKVANERQAKLLEELAAEDDMKEQREAKKAKEAQKKKEKKEKQKQLKAEEKARKDAELALKEAETKAAEEKRLEETRKKKEEVRRKKEAERKAQEEERQRKEAEKLKRQQEERERQQEAERKQRELKAQEKKAKEESKRKERELREAKEKEAREKKAQEDKERRDRETKAKAEKDRVRKEEQAAAAAQNPAPTSKKSSQPVAVALPPGLLKQTSSTGVPSPHVTPAIPKAPTPSRPRQSSHQGSHGSSPKTPHGAPGTSKSMSPASQAQNPIVPKSILTKPPTSQQPLPVHHAQPASPMLPLGPPPGMHGPPGMNMPTMPPGLNGFTHGQGPMMPGMAGPRPGMGPAIPMFPQPGTQNFRGFPPPSVHSPHPMPIGRGFPLEGPPGFPGMPAFGGPNQMPGFGVGLPSHSRQASGSFEKPNVESSIAASQAQPIQRPAPIQRPSSVKPHEENNRPLGSDIDELANHLGSKALLDDADDVADFPHAEPRRTSLQTHGSLRGAPLGFPFSDAPGQARVDSYAPFGTSSHGGSVWSTPPMPFPMPGAPGWGNSPTTGFFHHPSTMMDKPRPGEQRIVWIRRLVCTVCRQVATRQPGDQEGFLDASEVLQQVESTRSPSEVPVSFEDVKEACDIFGDPSNGGGSLEYKEAKLNSKVLTHIKFVEGVGHTTTLGEIGSPVPGHSVPVGGGFGSRPFPGLGAQGF